MTSDRKPNKVPSHAEDDVSDLNLGIDCIKGNSIKNGNFKLFKLNQFYYF